MRAHYLVLLLCITIIPVNSFAQSPPDNVQRWAANNTYSLGMDGDHVSPVGLLAVDDTTRLVAMDGEIGDEFGFSISASGDYVLVGARGDDISQGSAYVFKREGDTWSEHQKLVASTRTDFDFFGTAAFIDGDWALVGANGSDDGQGAVYVFKRDGETWTDHRKLTASDGAGRGGQLIAGDEFGWGAISMTGDYALIGARGHNDRQGAVYVFKREGDSWTEQQKLVASDGAANDEFGFFLSVSGDYALIGAPGDDSMQGSAYIFKLEGESWIEQQKLVSSDGVAGDYFGGLFSLNGDEALIGSVFDDNEQGSVYVFTREEETWSEQQRIVSSDGASRDRFGGYIVLNGDIAMISSLGDDAFRGAAYIFKREEQSWVEQQKLVTAQRVAGANFGGAFAFNEEYAAITSFRDNGFKGAVYVFSGDFSSTGMTDVSNDRDELPEDFFLYQNYPNPFNPSTQFHFNLPEASPVRLVIYNTFGQEIEVVTENYYLEGEHRIEWQAVGLANGVYLYRLEASEYTATRKLILMK